MMPSSVESHRGILVVGGGIAGITTAVEAAEAGYEVYLVEKNPYLGGRVAQLYTYFPQLSPPPGWKPYDAARIDNLGFGKHPNVITNVMMERLAAPNGPTKGKILRPSDGKPVESAVFIQ